MPYFPRWPRRLYYAVVAAVFLTTLIIELVTLGTFGVEYSSTNSFLRKYQLITTSVCPLYGETPSEPYRINVDLAHNASCGFSLWGIVTIILFLSIWMMIQIVMAIVGKPQM